MGLHLDGMVTARTALDDLMTIRRYWDLYGRPGDQSDTEDNPPVPIHERMRQAVCDAPSSALDVAAWFGLPVGQVWETMLILLRRGEVGFCGGLYGPPDDLTKKPVTPLTKQERICLSACATCRPNGVGQERAARLDARLWTAWPGAAPRPTDRGVARQLWPSAPCHENSLRVWFENVQGPWSIRSRARLRSDYGPLSDMRRSTEVLRRRDRT